MNLTDIMQLIDMLTYWRVTLSVIIGIGIGFFFQTHVTGEIFQWLALIFFSILGFVAGIIWQSKKK